MKKLFLSLSLCLIPALVLAQEKHTFKKYSPQVGENVLFSAFEKSHQLGTILPQGTVILNRPERKTYFYNDTIQEVKNGKPVKMLRSFAKYSTSNKSKGPMQSTGLAKRKVLIDLTGKKPVFTYYDDNSPVRADHAALLASDVDESDEPQIGEVLFPKKPVAVGETWDGELGKMLKAFDMKEEDIDKKKSYFRGTLTKVSTVKGKKIGHIHVQIYVYSDRFKIPNINNAKGFIKMEGTIQVHLDGSGPPKKEKMKMTSSITGTVQGQNGPMTVKIEVTASKEGHAENQGIVK